MKLKIVLYILSLIILFTAIFLMIEYADSGRLSLIAGALTAIGFSLNIATYIMTNNQTKEN